MYLNLSGLFNFSDVNVLKIQRGVVGLKFNLAAAVNGLVPLPVIFHDHVVHHQLTIKVNSHPLADHFDVKSIPGADRIISALQRLVLIFLVVVKSA